MRIQIFTIPIYNGEVELEALNKFLVSHRVTDVQKTFVATGHGGAWTFCIMYIETSKTSTPEAKKGKVDYRQELEEKDFAVFCELRKVRRQIADSEAIPPFAVFTDAELAEIAKLTELSPKTMMSIPGIGERKTEKYCAKLIEYLHATSRESDDTNSRL